MFNYYNKVLDFVTLDNYRLCNKGLLQWCCVGGAWIISVYLGPMLHTICKITVFRKKGKSVIFLQGVDC